jgi:hypothetical protein
MRRLPAAAIALGLTALAYGVVLGTVGDVTFRSTAVPPGREHRAALAIRDDVTTFQKWGTEMFTRQYLRRYYAAAWYFTQAQKGDQEAEFVACLDRALERYPQVDLFLLAHTNRYVKWVAGLPEERRRHLRFVYNTGCHNEAQNARWLEVGAEAYVGHPGVTWSPVFYYFFLRRWTRGSAINEAVEVSNRHMERVLKAWEWISWGRWDAAALIRETTASCYGDGQLRLVGDLK